ncbi:RNA-binding protein 34 [Ceratitis capitata]|uniref:(Mediterranean fruit fly) hypothetical protein n=1 Tax=Ceratitis capitata TaxID=7213 RepID=W8C4U3_CERCA|nr:RNA-binding protein 34 [Ceratitis capitata]CAD6994959.1 unnamed protein product [Ceratitis capitata]
MTKNKNSELKTNVADKGVLEKSKKIKKNNKKILNDKKLAQAVDKNGKDVAKKSTSFPNGNINTASAAKPKKQKKSKKNLDNVNRDASVEAISGQSVDKIEKKKAKKLAKKLKKQEKKEAKKSEGISKGDGNKSDGQVADVSKSKQKIKNSDKQKPNESKERDPIKEAATVFVGNLPVNTKRVQLLRLFKEYAPVNGIRFRTSNGKVLFKHKHRKEAGTLNAWVVLNDAETATRALNLNGTVFKNNHLRITRADAKNDYMDVKRTILVGNLKYSANEEKLREIFSSCGEIDYVRCLRSEKGCKGVAYVCFKSPEAVGLALELNETILDERPIHVERYSAKKLSEKKPQDTSEDTKKKELVKKNQKNKVRKNAKEGNLPKKPSTTTATSSKPKYRGVKVDGIKKQKKKVTSKMQKLANKIAPKEKN